MTVSMCVLLWARPGERDALFRYEDAVLALLPEHGGQVVRRLATVPTEDQPDEVQFLAFGSAGDVDSYMADPRRLALAPDRDAAVARTEVVHLAEAVQR